MKILLGIGVVLVCVFGGFLLHEGNLRLLVIPSEFLIIGGMLAGSLITSSPPYVVKHIFQDLMSLLKDGTPTKEQYVEVLMVVYELFHLVRKDGLLPLEQHITTPEESPVLSRYPGFLKNHDATAFLCDSMRLSVDGMGDPLVVRELMARDLDTLHKRDLEPSAALQRAADALPAIGIVAAVLGIILTMQVINEGALTVGQRVAGALVGTFLGVFLAYGIVGPLAAALESHAKAWHRFRLSISHALRAEAEGLSPVRAVEIARRSIYPDQRPTFEEVEQALNTLKNRYTPEPEENGE